MSKIKEPMLAADAGEDLNRLTYPLLASPKLDGIRCLRINDRTLSRKFLDIPNKHIQDVMSNLMNGLDGELVIDGMEFNDIQSAVMSADGEPNFKFYVFDYVESSLTEPYNTRMEKLKLLPLPEYCEKVLPIEVNSLEEVLEYKKKCLAEGYEGIMLRDPKGPYKCGRSTFNQGYLLKLKEFYDSEAEIIGFVEKMSNQNKAEVDELGKTKRSKAKAGLVPAGTLGKLRVREIGNTPWHGEEFSVGVLEGFDDAAKKAIWDNQAEYLGKILSYKYQKHGTKNLPRIPIGKGIRSPLDMS